MKLVSPFDLIASLYPQIEDDEEVIDKKVHRSSSHHSMIENAGGHFTCSPLDYDLKPDFHEFPEELEDNPVIDISIYAIMNFDKIMKVKDVYGNINMVITQVMLKVRDSYLFKPKR